jgi:uncharacterized protein (DUF983 family)
MEQAGSEYLVGKGCGCPKCGEERMDYLEINDDDEVLCATCGNKYSLTEKEEGEVD